jgi:UDP-GlcNAc3NAcA epimerase
MKPLRVCTIIGARPQFIKAAAVSAKFASDPRYEETIIHTGQHYDPAMSGIFFDELGIPREKHNLEIGSGAHGEQTGRMLAALETVLVAEKPDWVLVYGDTNSTLAGALAAVKLHLRAAHVEAGMRSFNRRMPEEVNRVVADHLCDLNLCSTETAMNHLAAEGRGDTAQRVGDVMYDAALGFADLAARHADPLGRLGLAPGGYALATCHRAENTDDPVRLSGILHAFGETAKTLPLVWPMHPRTQRFLTEHGLSLPAGILTVPPVSYLEMLLLERHARLLLTDSGGMQKEAFFYRVPCVTLRDETEWVETVALGWNVLVGAHPDRILAAVAKFAATPPPATSVEPYGDGHAAGKILDALA